MRRWRAANPVKAAYHNLKSNAKRRGKAFNLTLQDFKDFCQATDYIKSRGRKATCYHVDRIDETKGYSRENIQPLTNSANVKKYVQFCYGPAMSEEDQQTHGRFWFETRIGIKSIDQEPDAPF